MSEKERVINAFNNYLLWLNTLSDVNKLSLSKPIEKDKWSVREIVVHIMKWDEYLLSELISSRNNVMEIVFPDFDDFNKLSSTYANSGVSTSKLLKESKEARRRLVMHLKKLTTNQLNQQLIVNGSSHCPNKGTPYTILKLIEEFIEHDNHHMEQVMIFFKR